MLARPGPFYFVEIAYALARLPGSLKIDLGEANRILDDMTEWYDRGHFAEDEIMVKVPPQQLQLLKTVLDNAQRRGEIGPSLAEIRVCAILTHAAAKRYVQASGLAGAPRLLREWFGAESEPVNTRRRPGPQPILRHRLAEQMLDDLRSKRRSVEQLEADTLAALAAHYGGSPNTAKDARDDALEKFLDFR